MRWLSTRPTEGRILTYDCAEPLSLSRHKGLIDFPGRLAADAKVSVGLHLQAGESDRLTAFEAIAVAGLIDAAQGKLYPF